MHKNRFLKAAIVSGLCLSVLCSCTGAPAETTEVNEMNETTAQTTEPATVTPELEGYNLLWADEFDGEWELVLDGKTAQRGQFGVPHIAPLTREKVDLPMFKLKEGVEAFLNVTFKLKEATLWAEKGWPVSRNQLRLSPKAAPRAALDGSRIKAIASADGRHTEVVAGSTKAVFSAETGTLCELVMHGRTILRDAARGVAMPAFCKYICPAGTLEGAVGLLSNPVNEEHLSLLNGLFTGKFVIMVGLATLSVFIYRVFCRFLCPLGAIYGLFSRVSLFGVTVDTGRCTHCGLCKAACPVDIRSIGDHECIQCGACRNVCPEKAIDWKRISRHES